MWILRNRGEQSENIISNTGKTIDQHQPLTAQFLSTSLFVKPLFLRNNVKPTKLKYSTRDVELNYERKNIGRKFWNQRSLIFRNLPIKISNSPASVVQSCSFKRERKRREKLKEEQEEETGEKNEHDVTTVGNPDLSPKKETREDRPPVRGRRRDATRRDEGKRREEEPRVLWPFIRPATGWECTSRKSRTSYRPTDRG